MDKRKIGNSDIAVTPLGFGGWAIGGPYWAIMENGAKDALGWGVVDDRESIRAIHRALDVGIDFFDTANIYGCGHSERILGQALAEQRSRVTIATKFGFEFDETSRTVVGMSAEKDNIVAACEGSLRRLGVDVIDLYQFHINEYPIDKAADVRDQLERLAEQGKIRYYAWSTDSPARARVFAEGDRCVAFQHQINALDDAPEMIALCEEHNMASINRGPLAMGLLTGKYNLDATLPDDDVRGANSPDWMKYFRKGKPNSELLRRAEAMKEILTSEGRSMAQGALAWLWARSEKTIPIPGCRTPSQVEANAGALQFGALNADQMTAVAALSG